MTFFFTRYKRNLTLILIAAVLLLALVAFVGWFYSSHPHFIPESTYVYAHKDRVMSTTDSEKSEALSDLIHACSQAYTSVYGGEIKEAFITVSCGHEAWASFYATVVQPDGEFFHVRIPFSFYDGDVVYRAFDGSYNYEELDTIMELRSSLALNRMFDVSVTVIDGELSIDSPHFTAVQAEDALTSKLYTEEVVRLNTTAVNNINGMFKVQGIDAFQVQEAFVTSYYWQYMKWFSDHSYEFQPTILWIRSTSGLLYTFELPSESDRNVSYPNQFVDDLNDPDCWFIFVFDNDGTISQLSGPMAPGVFKP